MKKLHVSRLFTQRSNGFDIESPIDIPTIDSLETLWEWMKYWKSNIPFIPVCHFYKLPDSDDYEFVTHQIISSSYVTYNGSRPVRTSCTVKNIVAINNVISIYINGHIKSNPIIIPSNYIYPVSHILIEPTKIIDIPFSMVEQEIANKL